MNIWKNGNESSNIAFVDIEILPEYSFCLKKKDSEVNTDEIFNKIISTGVTYYKYYAVMVNNEEKYYVSSFQECENIINQLKEKDSNNIDSISYTVKYAPSISSEFVISYTSSGGKVATGANIRYDKIELGITFINPVGGKTSSRFGELSSIRSSYHTGLDIANPIGTPIAAAASGTVIFSGWKSAYGQMVVIDHGNGVQTYYDQ